MKLESKAKRISAVLTLKGMDDPADVMAVKGCILEFLKEEDAQRYAFILHDCDINAEGEEKTPHIHLYAEFTASGRRLGTYLNLLASYTLLNPLAISVEKATDPEAVIQYLIHKNAPEKYQYPVEQVITNIPKDELEMIMSHEDTAFTVDYIQSVWNDTKPFKADFIRIIGLERYRLYRNVIKDILSWR